MLNFSTDQWVIILLIFVLGLLIGGFLFSGGGRKWKTRYNTEVDRRTELERTYTQREKDWREQDSLRAAAAKNQRPVVDDHDTVLTRDRDADGVRDDRDPVDNRKL